MFDGQDERHKKNWVSLIKKLLMESGFGFVWNNQGVQNDKGFLREFKQRLINCYQQIWHSELQSSEKYAWFLQFNCDLQCEKYLRVVTRKWHRDCLARFRTRTLGLQSSQRWYITDIQLDATCKVCASNNREDEQHFFFHCEAYKVVREKCSVFASPLAQRRDLPALLKLTRAEDVNSIAKYVAEASNIREKLIDSIPVCST